MRPSVARSGLALVVGLVALAGCTAYRTAPDLMADSAPALPSTIVVDPGGYPLEHADKLVETLRRTALFDSVELNDTPSATDLVARLDRDESATCFSEPFLTVLSAGVIPNVSCTSIGYRIDLVQGRDVTTIDTRRDVRTVWGWAAGVLNLFGGWQRNIDADETEELRHQIVVALRD